LPQVPAGVHICVPQKQKTGSSHHLCAPGLQTQVPVPPLDPLVPLAPLVPLVPPLAPLVPLEPPLVVPPLAPLVDEPSFVPLDPLVPLVPPLAPLVPLVPLEPPLVVPPLVPPLEPSLVPPLEPPLVVPPLVPAVEPGVPSDVSPQLSPVDALMQGPHCENSPPAGRHLRIPSRHALWPHSMRVPGGPHVQPIFGVSQLVGWPLKVGESVPFALPLEPHPGVTSMNTAIVPNRAVTRHAFIRIGIPSIT
jgi:hypothetical protein